MTNIIEDRAAKLPEITIASGGHSSFEEGGCAMELASWIAGEPWSDHPNCVCPVIGAFMRSWNDALPDEDRTRLLLPLIAKTVGTRGSAALANRRATMATDWLIRVHTPAWLRLAGLTVHADTLASLPEITDFAKTPALMPALEAARKDAAAARDAARDAAWAAAGDAAWAAAGDAARAAARAALKSTVSELQVSAVDLVEWMCALEEAN